jgi:hypothetical protein
MIDINAITDAVVSRALALGLFDRVNAHEPKAAPGSGVTAAAWVDRIEPANGGSGLNATTVRLAFNVRLFMSMLAEPQDAIDPAMMAGVSALMDAYTGDFDLGGLIRDVDVLGQFGTGLSAQAGYVSQDKRLYRVFTITLPLIINDVFAQEA